MKIKKIKINNFRNYKGLHIFNLSPDINILYGENGNGKSSFFDGLEWCLTGKIARFSGNKPPKEAIANKEMLNIEECFVEIYFTNLCLRRSFIRNENGFGNIEFTLFVIDNDSIMEKVASGEDNVDAVLRKRFREEGIEYKDVKYRVGEVINKAYILSQDQVTDFVTRDKPNERFSALASIMGFEKILKLRKNLVNSKRYISDSIDNFNKEEVEIRKDIDRLREKIKPIDKIIASEFMGVYGALPKDRLEIKEKYERQQKLLFNLDEDLINIQKIYREGIDTTESIENKITFLKELVVQDEALLEKRIIDENKLKTELETSNAKLMKIQNNEMAMAKLSKALQEKEEIRRKLIELNLGNITESYERAKSVLFEKEQEDRKINFAKKYIAEYHQSKSTILHYFKMLEDHINMLNINRTKINILRKEESQLTSTILNYEDKDASLNVLIKNIEEIQNYLKMNNTNGSCPVCLSKVGENLEEVIQENIINLMNNLGFQKDEVSKQMKQKETLSHDIFKISNLIKQQENTIDNINMQYRNAHESINNIEGNLLFSNFFTLEYEAIIDKEKEIKDLIKKIRRALEYLTSLDEQKEKDTINSDNESSISNIDLNSLSESIITKKQFLKELTQEINKLKDKISINKKTVFDLHNIQEKVQYYLVKYKQNSVGSVILTIEKQQRKGNHLLQLFDNIEGYLNNDLYNSEIKTEIKSAMRDLGKIKISRKNAERKLLILKQILSRMDREYGEEATDFLNNKNSSIQTYYRYLNPSPGHLNRLHFEVTDNENLFIKIFENGTEIPYLIDANMVLSSGQLNVLALAIFIATNEAQNCSYFDFLAIDDPIQNMDDINRFSICDILGNLDRQLIFSTHDEEFLNLFLKKNEEKNSRISLFMLNVDENSYKPIELNK
jgi:DNA repair protein SbcC/Rad50